MKDDVRYYMYYTKLDTSIPFFDRAVTGEKRAKQRRTQLLNQEGVTAAFYSESLVKPYWR